MDLFDLLVRYETELWNHLDRQLRDRGLISVAQLSALGVINGHGDSGRVQEVADELAITVGAASKLVDRLEAAGLVDRRSHPTDRRSSFLALTAKGHDRLSRARSAAETELAAQFEVLSDAESQALTSVLVRLRERLTPAVTSSERT